MDKNSSPDPIPSIHLQPASVDFIDNHLPKYHGGFRNIPARYDPTIRRYLPMSPSMASHDSSAGLILQYDSVAGDNDNEQDEPGQPSESLTVYTPVTKAMEFWIAIYDPSIKTFTTKYPEPKGELRTIYSIRHAENWEMVYSQLQLAREAYDGTKKGAWGRRMKNASRSVADRAGSVARVAKFIPEGSFTTPIRASVEVLLDAVKVASDTRKKVQKGLEIESLEKKFADIELFLTTFPRDEAIKKASIELVVAILKAIEDTIGFFVQHSLKRSFSAVMQGEKYQEPLLDSINLVSKCSEDLVHQALNSHIATTRDDMQAVLQSSTRLEVEHKRTSENVDKVLSDTAEIKDAGAYLLNLMKSLFDDAAKSRAEYLAEFEKIHSQIEEHLIRRLTPSPQPALHIAELHYHSPMLLGPPSYQQAQPPWATTGPVAGNIVVTDPMRQQSTWPPQPTIQQWTGLPLTYPAICDFLGITTMDEADLYEIMEGRDKLPIRYRIRAEQITTSQQFRDWAVVPTSRELLVQGDGLDNQNTAMALSLLCATITQALSKRPRYVALVYFCGLHTELDDEYAGGKALIRGLITQLLRHHSFNATFPHWEVNLESVKFGDVGQLCVLFGWLVRLLPHEATLVCVLDGIDHYDSDDFEEDMLNVLTQLLHLSRDDRISAAVKVLATTTSATELAQKAFKDDDSCLLSMTELPWVNDQAGIPDFEDMSDDENKREEIQAVSG